MILINKNKEPKEWTEYRNTPGADYKAIPELVDSLLREQGYICAYCMRRIPCKDNLCKKDRLTQEDHRVEHIKSRKLHDDLKLDYNNMVMCCPGHIGSEDHCDRLKGEKDISFSPLDKNFIATVKYRSDGTILSTDTTCNDEMNKILNLNTELLRKNRYNMLTEVIKEINSKCKNGQSWNKKRLTTYLRKYGEKHAAKNEERAEYYPYCGIVVWFLKKKLQKL